MASESEFARVQGILGEWQSVIGPDYEGYRNHAVRMAIFCSSLRPCSEEEKQKIAIAAAFHDIGIWTAKTVDYIEPSVPPALEYLKKNNLQHWAEEITLMISEHHKLTRYKDEKYPLVELFRQGDLVDFSLGLAKFGLAADHIAVVKNEYPNAGFHKNLVKLASAWFVRHPWNPAPMMKW